MVKKILTRGERLTRCKRLTRGRRLTRGKRTIQYHLNRVPRSSKYSPFNIKGGGWGPGIRQAVDCRKYQVQTRTGGRQPTRSFRSIDKNADWYMMQEANEKAMESICNKE